MSAKHAVLGLLIERPGHGYDVARRLQERFGSSGFAPTGVYSALDQLNGEGLVRATGSIAHGGSAPRTIYEATDSGRSQFDGWMSAESSVANIRDELNMKLALSRPRDLPGLIELARGQEQECLERLGELKLSGTSAQGRPVSWREVAELLLRDAEARQLQARIEWLQRAVAIMVRLSQGERQPERAVESHSGEIATRAKIA